MKNRLCVLSWGRSIALMLCLVIIGACGTVATPDPTTETPPDPPETAVADLTTTDLEAIAQDIVQGDCETDPIMNLGAEFAMMYPHWVSWFEFVYLNCAIETDTLVWEQWATNVGVYQPEGVAPPAWGTSALTDYALEDAPEVSGHRAETNNGEPILYEVRLNQGTYDYIVQRQWYNRDCQIDFFMGTPCDGDNSIADFPDDAMEIKSAWFILDADDPTLDQYYTINATYTDRDGNTQEVLAALAGFHFSSKILPNWLWATFEHIGNADETGIDPVDPVPDDIAALNTFMQAVLADVMPDLPWQYYQMRGTQIAFTNPDGTPTILANTLIETDFQTSSSCITCHALSTRGSRTQGRLAFLNITDEGMQGYVGDVARQDYFDSFEEPVCYDGTSDFFTVCDSGETVYRQLDFVWSLREAK